MGNGYFRTSQTRKDKRKTKELTYNYVDRVRLAENSLQDHKYPSRGSGWRHNNKSISHLDLATSCHSAANGLNHWSQARQLRHSRSLDYNHIDHCKEALDIAEFYWRIDPEEIDNYDEELQVTSNEQSAALRHSEQQQQQQQYYNNRDYNYADENYHSTNSIYQHHSGNGNNNNSAAAAQATLQAFDFGSESCSLRRSRSLAVIREETFSDLQITSANSNRRRSQLIPRARLVNRGFIRERERLIYANNKHHHHHENAPSEGNVVVVAQQQQHLQQQQQPHNSNSNSSAGTCDSHPQQRHHHHHCHAHDSSHSAHHQQPQQSREADDYYDNLKRLDALALGLAEQLHPWHNDKSDLESLNSDYFKNSLHQSHELKQQFDLEALEQAVNFLTNEKPRIYQSRRQQRVTQTTQHKAQAPTAADSYPENSQSSVFPETTTSNSDDQTDSPSLSEQEYDLKKIEKIFQKTQREAEDEESYEIISLTTTTRTRFETTEDEAEEEVELRRGTPTNNDEGGTLKRARASENLEKLIAYDSVYLSSEETGSEGTLIDDNCESYERTTITASVAETDVETSTLLHFSIEDIVYEPQAKQHRAEAERESRSKKLGEAESEQAYQVHESVNTKIEIVAHKPAAEATRVTPLAAEPILYTQILRVEHTASAQLPEEPSTPPPPPPPPPLPALIPILTTTVGVTSSAASKPKILSVVEKRKWKRYADAASQQATTSNTGGESATQRGLFEPLTYAHPVYGENTNLTHWQRQPNDSTFYAPFKAANLGDNQYHSLPDVNIGQSLKVSECIDAKLRSSYNLHKYQQQQQQQQQHPQQQQQIADSDSEPPSVPDETLAQTTTTTLVYENNHVNSKLKQREEIVTTEEIYDSIKRFGRAHQKARQKEYQELNELDEKEKQKEVKEKRIKLETKPEQQYLEATKAADEIVVVEEEEVEVETVELLAPTPEIVVQISTAEVSEAEEDAALSETEHLTSLAEDSISTGTATTSTTECSYEQCLEQPKEAPSIEVANFSKLIERRAKEIRLNGAYTKQQLVSEASTAPTEIGSNQQQQFRIIVTDAQNNVIEEDSIDGQCAEEAKLIADVQPANVNIAHTEAAQEIKEKRNKPSALSGGQNRLSSLKRVPSKSKRQQLHNCACCQPPHNNNSNNNNSYCDLSLTKSKERRVLSTPIYKARPAKVLTANDSLRRTAAASGKMSRPQILHVVDNKRKSDLLGGSGETQNAEGVQVESEYLKKVDAVRNYWTKLAKDEQRQQALDEADGGGEYAPGKEHNTNGAESSNEPTTLEPRRFVLGEQQDVRAKTAAANDLPARQPRDNDDFCSFMPSIEIFELDGEKRATIVSAVPPHDSSAEALSSDGGEQQFDHIRYKVLKSQQLIRSNILTARNKKEAQFDGLIQYLQDYSFQELLSNNNVVIVEPVRTKIERPLMTGLGGASKVAASTMPPAKTANQPNSSAAPKTNASAKAPTNAKAKQGHGSATVGGGIKRHFFYQPVRVNRELYEEELPNPDVVRNVRKFFEQHILPTPGRGVMVRERKECIEGQLKQQRTHANAHQSPKTRRARKYRYLTIDTTYGHAAQQQSQPQSQPHASPATRKWDTASLSSGISSGDLSSPCECNEAAAANNDEQRKGVHVQDVVRRHNNNGSNKAGGHTATNAMQPPPSLVKHDDVAKLKRRVRPHSAIYGPSADSSYYRDIYEYNAGRGRRETAADIYDDNEMFADDDGDDDDDDDDEDDEDELCESYYVSNDVLEKIRECGSSVTYYGGRVLQSSSPDPLCNNNGQFGYNAQAHSTMTLTRARAREIETCHVCQPNECPHRKQLQQQFPLQHQQQRHANNKDIQVENTPQKPGNSDTDAHLGIKFKLVKSNSCSSRLELAGAVEVALCGGAETETETEVVRKMVHHFESGKNETPKTRPAEELLTINNQTPVRVTEQQDKMLSQQVTVNNHINMPLEGIGAVSKASHDNAKGIVEPQQEALIEHTAEKTYQSSAMDIRLEVSERTKSQNGTAKICRNKNVDLAFTMAKQQQQQSQVKTAGTAKDIPRALTIQANPTAKNDSNQSEAMPQTLATAMNIEATHANSGSSSGGGGVTSITRTLESNLAQQRGNHEEAAVNGDNGDRKSIALTLKKPKEYAAAAAAPTTSTEAEKVNELKRIQSTATTPTQIIVPVEIHRTDADAADKPQPCLSTTSSSASLIDKAVVRQYVANDKSLFEKRKYDDIEFEEFEVYDPTKDFEKLIESAKEQHEDMEHVNQMPTAKCNDNSSESNASKLKSASASDEPTTTTTTKAVHKHKIDAVISNDGDNCEAKQESDCYDSLEDKL